MIRESAAMPQQFESGDDILSPERRKEFLDRLDAFKKQFGDNFDDQLISKTLNDLVNDFESACQRGDVLEIVNCHKALSHLEKIGLENLSKVSHGIKKAFADDERETAQ